MSAYADERTIFRKCAQTHLTGPGPVEPASVPQHDLSMTRRRHLPRRRHHRSRTLHLELYDGRSIEGVTARVAQRLLAMPAAIWHNRATGQPTTRSLIAYDHRPQPGPSPVVL